MQLHVDSSRHCVLKSVYLKLALLLKGFYFPCLLNKHLLILLAFNLLESIVEHRLQMVLEIRSGAECTGIVFEVDSLNLLADFLKFCCSGDQ